MRFLIAAVLAALMLAAWASGVLAQEPRTTLMDVAVVNEEATHLFSIGWERGELGVTLIAPDGTRIPQDAPPPGVRVAKNDRIIIFRVDNAMPGRWQAEYREFDNGRVACIVQKLIRPLLVENVTARQDGAEILVDFSLSGEAGKECTYSVSLTLDGDYSNGRLLAEGTAATGETVHLRYKADDVSSYNKFVLTVYAESESDGFTDFHSASSPPFAFSNPDAPGQVTQLTATLLEAGIQLAWQPPAVGQPDGYLAVVYGADGSVTNSVTVEAGDLQAVLPLAATGIVQVGVSTVRGTVCSLPVMVTVDSEATFAGLVGFNLPDKPEIAGGQVQLAYVTAGAAVPLTADINGVVSDMTLSDSGLLKLAVHNGTNRVTVSAQGKDGVWLSQKRTWMIDLVAPGLRLFEDWDALVTRESAILLAGSVDGADAVTVNGKDALIEPNGNFSAQVPLGRGLNLVRVTAKDAAGNATVYEARIDRQGVGGFPWWLAAGVCVVGLAITGYVLLSKKRRVRA
jgi:hypothetical protein